MRGADGVGVTWVALVAIRVSKNSLSARKNKESGLPDTSAMGSKFV
jgi:hypothetical protein